MQFLGVGETEGSAVCVVNVIQEFIVDFIYYFLWLMLLFV